ncbi:MAG TPA: efflux RND transporter periplasmic adaptor subunit [Fimbriimonadaceae bacterium]|nr:efflux RND transporter periplasmic adaptor subunit [Fimbriimonadaceae bacterium]
MRRFLSLIAVPILLAGCGSNESKTAETSSGEVVPASIQTVQPIEAPVYFEATGTVKARLNAILSSKVMARVSGVSVREGDQVKAGQTLVILDSRELSAAVEVARANLSASNVGVDNARTAHDMEVKTSAARISQAQAAVAQSRAALSAAQSRLDLALAGPRIQEKTQAHLAVEQAESSLKLAKVQLDRISNLVSQGAMPQKNLDVAQNAYDVALAQRDTAVQAEKMAQEGSRSEDIRAAREGVAQAQAAVKQAESNLAQAKAAALQSRVRAEEIRAAQAQVDQSAAALRSSEVSLGYASIQAPFDGWITQRAVDPGAMATAGSPLLTIEGGELRLEAVVPESVLPHVRLGDQVDVKLDALGNMVCKAAVAEIVPQGDMSTHSFVVKLTLPRTPGVKSGMFGRAAFLTGKESRIEVPAGSAWEREGLHYVFAVNREGVARLRIVTLGDSDGSKVVVLSGLSAGERIVTGDRSKVVDGVKVVSK